MTTPPDPNPRFIFAACPECGAEVTSAEHNRDIDPLSENQRHQGWTLQPCGHHPTQYPRPACAHPEQARQPSVMYREDEATYCKQCRSLVFADGRVERVQITGVRTTKR